MGEFLEVVGLWELFEEIGVGVDKVMYLGIIKDWIVYDYLLDVWDDLCFVCKWYLG